MVTIAAARQTNAFAFFAHLFGLNTFLESFDGGSAEMLSYALESIIENKDLWAFEYVKDAFRRETIADYGRPGYVPAKMVIEQVVDLVSKPLIGVGADQNHEIAPFLIDVLLRLPTSFEISETILSALGGHGEGFHGISTGVYVEKGLKRRYEEITDGRIPVVSQLRNMVDDKDYYDADDILTVYSQALSNHVIRFPDEFAAYLKKVPSERYMAEYLIKSSHVKPQTVDRFYRTLKEIGLRDRLLTRGEKKYITRPLAPGLNEFNNTLSITRNGMIKGRGNILYKSYTHPELKKGPAKGDKTFYAKRFVDKFWIQLEHLSPDLGEANGNRQWSQFMLPLCQKHRETNSASEEVFKALIYYGLMKLHEEGICLYSEDLTGKSILEQVREHFYPGSAQLIDEVCSKVEHDVFSATIADPEKDTSDSEQVKQVTSGFVI